MSLVPGPPTITGALVQEVVGLNDDFLSSLADVDDDTFHRRPGATAPSIGFHLWHIARWADLFQARLPTFAVGLGRLGPRDEIWAARDLAGAWGMRGSLGRNDTGWGLDDDASAALPLPAKDAVVEYASAAFEAATGVFAGLRDDELLSPTDNIYGEVEEWVVLDHFGWYTGHGGRHLGMIEALKGVLGMRGTVTS
jgi:hypothetical protein